MDAERASGARAHIAIVDNVDYAEALRLRNADAAARFNALAPRSTRESAAHAESSGRRCVYMV